MKKTKTKKKKTEPEKKPETKEEFEQEDAKPFDFGGLPQRDLKKNLGCG